MMQLAPIVLFVYNRPWHTEQTLNALMQNEWADQSILYIYSDGQKENAGKEEEEKIQEVRELIRSKEWCKEVHIIESERNKGLADSIIHGVTEVVNKYGKIIVLEDDIVTSKGFLKYMNDALALYQEEDRVMHISGYMYPHNSDLPETFFFNVPLCWGWATWDRAWKNFNPDALQLYVTIDKRELWQDLNKFGGDYLGLQLKQNIAGTLNTWFIKWHASVLVNGGFTLYPGNSMVQNIGFDNSGIHNGKTDKFQHNVLSDKIFLSPISLTENKEAANAIYNFYQVEVNAPTKKRKLSLLFNRIKRKSRSILRRALIKIYPELEKIRCQNSIVDNYINDVVCGKCVKLYDTHIISQTIVGSYSYISTNAKISKTLIGKFCSIGPNFLCGWGIHPVQGISTSPMFYSNLKQNGLTLSTETKIVERKLIQIGNDVFIGANVTILDGVTVGDGAIVGAGAIVSKNVPAYAIAVGNPIKILKYRFEDEQIENLLKIKWWNFPDDELQVIEKYFFDVDEFIKKNIGH